MSTRQRVCIGCHGIRATENPNETHRLNCSVFKVNTQYFPLVFLQRYTETKTSCYLFIYVWKETKGKSPICSSAQELLALVEPHWRHQKAPPGWQQQRQRAQSKRTDLLRGLVARPGVRRGTLNVFSGNIFTLCYRLGAHKRSHAHDGGATHPAGAERGWGERRSSIKKPKRRRACRLAR